MIPEQPTPETIVTEALRRFYNGGDPDTDEIQRGIDFGLEKVKRDIMGAAKTWRPLIKTDFLITSPGIPQYSNPADFEGFYTVGVMSRSHEGVIANIGNATTLTLDPASTASEAEAVGKLLLIASGPGALQARIIYAYNPTTRICTLAYALDTLPAPLDRYAIIDRVKDIPFIQAARYDQFESPGRPGTPQRYTNLPDDGAGKTVFHPVPDTGYGIRRRYFVDLLKLDTDSALYMVIFRRWAGLLEQGVLCWKLQEDDDRYQEQYGIYQAMLLHTLAHDMVGFDAEQAAKATGTAG